MHDRSPGGQFSLHKVQNQAYNTLYPVTNKTKCTIMLFPNLALPEWMNINCKVKILQHVVCSQNPKEAETAVMKLGKKDEKCQHDCIVIHGTCYCFLWMKDHSVKTHLDLHISSVSNDFLNHHEFFTLSTQGHISPIFENSQTSWKFDQSWDKYRKINTTFAQSHYKIFVSAKAKQTAVNVLFLCEVHLDLFVSRAHLCDNITDCVEQSDSSDEAFCHCKSPNTSTPMRNSCKTLTDGNNKTSCSPLYQLNKDSNCVKFLPKARIMKPISPKFYHCNNGNKFSKYVQDDLIGDCQPLWEDENILQNLLEFGLGENCSMPNQIPCLPGHSRCFNISHVCMYKLNKDNHILECRNGAHLKYCGMFECNIAFKCPGSYCIPWLFLCDEKWDCPSGYDERICNSSNRCRDMFKCKGKGIKCIHLGQVCDNQPDCVLGDDEILCELHGIQCVSQCQCLMLAILCIESDVLFLLQKSYQPYVSVVFYSFKIGSVKQLKSFVFVQFLTLINVQLTCLCKHHVSRKLSNVVATKNFVTEVKERCFGLQLHLKHLQLSDNKITFVQQDAFADLNSLTCLNLSNNFISDIKEKSLPDSVKLQVISVFGNPIENVGRHAFATVVASIIETTNYHICCVVPDTTQCHAEPPCFFLCSDLLPAFELQVFLPTLSIILVILNVLSVPLHWVTRKSNTSYSLTVIAINTNDVLLGIYFFIIWGSHLVFQGDFVVKEKRWRTQVSCFAAFFHVLVFNILIPQVLCFLALSRLMIVLHPIDTKFKRTKFVSRVAAAIFVCSFLISFSITLAVKFVHLTLPTSLCLPFVDPNNSVVEIISVTWFVATTQVIASVIIVCIHAKLVFHLRGSLKHIQCSKSKENTNVSLVVQLVIISASNILCWIPTNLVYVLCLFLLSYPFELIIWTSVSVAPLNSVISPVVFIFTCLRKIHREKRKIPM